MAKLTAAKRARLPKSDFGCPLTRGYPIHDKSRVASARSYYRRKGTTKCRGGKTRICRRAKRFGMLAKKYPGSAEWRKWCN